jgi:hypothetical protein
MTVIGLIFIKLILTNEFCKQLYWISGNCDKQFYNWCCVSDRQRWMWSPCKVFSLICKEYPYCYRNIWTLCPVTLYISYKIFKFFLCICFLKKCCITETLDRNKYNCVVVFILYRRETTKLTTTFTMQKEVVVALKIRVDQTSCSDVYWTVLLHDQSCTCIYIMYCKNKLFWYTHTHIYI